MFKINLPNNFYFITKFSQLVKTRLLTHGGVGAKAPDLPPLSEAAPAKRIFAGASLLFIVFNTFFLECKSKKKLPEFYDPNWRDESNKISTEICKKLSECFEKHKKSSNSPHIQTHVQKNLQTSKCTEKHKKSNVYLLRGANPEEIKKNFLTCYEDFKTLSCDQIYSGGISNIPECKWISELQKL